jgi:hypothetical protein
MNGSGASVTGAGALHGRQVRQAATGAPPICSRPLHRSPCFVLQFHGVIYLQVTGCNVGSGRDWPTARSALSEGTARILFAAVV